MTTAVAVTGAAGFVGRALCAHLAARGMEVRALVREPAAFPRTPGTRAATCDLPGVLDESGLAGAQAVVHCAYATREIDQARARRVNEEGTKRLRDAARRAGVRRFVFVSTIAAYDGAPSYYARSKYAVEQTLDAADTIVRPGLVVGRGGHGLFQQLLDNMRRMRAVPLFDGGRQPLQTVHLDDLCEAIGRVVERDLSGAFNVAEPAPPTLAQFLRMMAARLKIRCVFLPLPFRPVLGVVRAIEAARLPFPLRSESLLGLQGLRAVAVTDDLARLGVTVRPAAASLDDVLGPPSDPDHATAASVPSMRSSARLILRPPV